METSPELYLFFAGKPEELALSEALLDRIGKEAGPYTLKAQKTQISLYSRHIFCCLSLLRVRKKSELPPHFVTVTFGLPSPLASSRIAAKTEAVPNRWTHHLVLGTPDEIDGELLGWIRAAYDFSVLK